MKVAIVIPVYNTATFLEKCIESVFNQTYKKIQVIVVNDGSTDNSNELILKLKKEYDFEYISKENGGLSSARNEALKHVDSDFVFFLDSDDYLKENAIENLVLEAKNNDIIIGNYCYTYSNQQIKEKVDSKFEDLISGEMSNFDYFDYFYGGLYGINACNKLYRSSLIYNSKVKFQPNNEIFAEDLLFNMKLIAGNNNIKIHVIKDITYYYYQNIESITHSYKEKLAERYSNCVNDYASYASKDNRGITYLACNAINCICAQEREFKKIYEAIKSFASNLDKDVAQNSISLNYLKSLPIVYRIDYGITCICLDKANALLAIYQKLKNIIRGR